MCTRELRPEFIKIDGYFARGVEHDPVKLEFVRSIIDMARAVGSHVIVEGVETLEQCRELFDLDVDGLQGYLCGGLRGRRREYRTAPRTRVPMMSCPIPSSWRQTCPGHRAGTRAHCPHASGCARRYPTPVSVSSHRGRAGSGSSLERSCFIYTRR